MHLLNASPRIYFQIWLIFLTDVLALYVYLHIIVLQISYILCTEVISIF